MKLKSTVLESEVIKYIELGVSISVSCLDEVSFNLPAGWDIANISKFDNRKRLVFVPTSKRTYFLWLDIVVSRLSKMLDVSPDYFISTYIARRLLNSKRFTISTLINALYF